jgi:hypothetical protein
VPDCLVTELTWQRTTVSHHHLNLIVLSLLFFPFTPVIYILKIQYGSPKPASVDSVEEAA